MPFTFNDASPLAINYNGKALQALKFNGEVVWQLVPPVTDMYPLETKSFGQDYYTNAITVNSDNAQIGRATADKHMGAYLKFQKPSDWDKIETMVMHVYRKSGSAGGNIRIGSTDSVWTDALPYNDLWYQSSANYVEKECSGNEGWKDFDIIDLKPLFVRDAHDDYFVVTLLNRSAYMFADMSIDTEYTPWIEINV